MNKFTAGILTVLLMGLMLWAGVGPSNWPSAEAPSRPGAIVAPAASDATIPEPVNPAEARVQTLLESARTGDVSAYLDGFQGVLRQRLEREVNERGRAAFADDLRAAALRRKSHAVFAAEPDGPSAALVSVESVYPEGNESQTYRVEQDESSDAWLVTDVETVRSRQPIAKYGSPAVFLAPEGNPVEGAIPNQPAESRAGVIVETGDDPAETTRPEGAAP